MLRLQKVWSVIRPVARPLIAPLLLVIAGAMMVGNSSSLLQVAMGLVGMLSGLVSAVYELYWVQDNFRVPEKWRSTEVRDRGIILEPPENSNLDGEVAVWRKRAGTLTMPIGSTTLQLTYALRDLYRERHRPISKNDGVVLGLVTALQRDRQFPHVDADVIAVVEGHLSDNGFVAFAEIEEQDPYGASSTP